MANVDRPDGFRLRNDLMGYMPPLVKVLMPASDAVATFVGDGLKFLNADAATDAPDAVPVTQATAGAAMCGVLMSVDQREAVAAGSVNMYRLHRPASTKMYGYAVLDPNAIFEIQEDGNMGVDSIGANASIIVAAGSTTTGRSAMELDTTTLNTTATLELKILGFVNREDNDPTLANARLIVKINNHQLGSSTGTAGMAV